MIDFYASIAAKFAVQNHYFAGYSTSYDPKIFEKGVVIFIVLNATPL